jgi:hypothetical protein
MNATLPTNSQPISHDEDRILSITLLAKRWNCSTQIAIQRVRKFKIPLLRFNQRAKGVMLSAVLRTEEALSRPITEQEEALKA